MGKTYPLQVETMHDLDNSDVLGYYTKGHHDLSEFVDVLVSQWGVDDYLPDHPRFRQTWLRFEFCDYPDDNRNANALALMEHNGPGRGVFPVTMLDLS